MRTLIASAFVLLACGFAGGFASGCADSSSRSSGAGAPPSIPGGPDPIVLRVPRAGGVVSAYAYPSLDSALWRSSGRVPALDRVIAFGVEDGYLAAVDTGGAPVRIDLRLGTVSSSCSTGLRSVTSADGADVYALTAAGEITRFTPSGGSWKFAPSLPANALFAQDDGSVIVAGAQGGRVLVWRVRPPGQGVSDSLSFIVSSDGMTDLAATVSRTGGAVGDRVFFGANKSVLAVRSRDMGRALDVAVGGPVVAIAATPSGDRLYVALADEPALSIVDRFEEDVSGTVSLPTAVRELRMDPLGRVLLARGAGDTVYVISVATDAVVGTVRSEWRGDLPLVLPDGAIALARDRDVVLADPRTLADGRQVVGGARDIWHVLRWNGFRPRAAGLDRPVEFRRGTLRDTTTVVDTTATVDSGAGTLPSPVTSPGTSPVASPVTPPARTPRAASRSARDSAFTVSFAALLDERDARDLANRIRVDGQRARVTTSERAGRTLYRVVLGPYPTRDQAERVGRTAGQSYWIFEGSP
ncbi:MAG TPA: SPOR domain-containing protein [Gemmatimonas sp.]|nr:SPOR domain-containing protein [Gemmatimonas sp.]